MFDKLIVSEPEGADFKNRRSYFMVSSIVVGALFLTAVVISIYSADIGLGNDRAPHRLNLNRFAKGEPK